MNRLFFIIICFLLPAVASACSCISKGPFCADLPAGDSANRAVFIGTVIEVYPSESVMGYFEALYGRKATGGRQNWTPSLNDLKKGLLKIWRSDLTAEESRRLSAARTEREIGPLLDGVFWVHGRKVRFAVSEWFTGPATPNFELFTGQGLGDCGIQFKTGEAWLISADQDPKSRRWSSDICGRSERLMHARSEVAALRAWKSGRVLAPHIYGVLINETQRRGSQPPTFAPLGGVRVTLRTEDGKRLETKTDEKGNFHFENLEKKRYTLDLPLPGWSFETNPRVGPVLDLTTQPCAQYYGYMREDKSSSP